MLERGGGGGWGVSGLRGGVERGLSARDGYAAALF